MKPSFRQLAALCIFSLFASCQKAPDAARQNTWVQCQACHDGRPAAAGPDLRGLDPDYLKHQLEAFAAGRRGAHPDDPLGQLMRQAAAGLKPEDYQAAAEHFALQTPPRPHPRGEASMPGAKIYQERCHGCHSSAFGRFFTGSPRIDTLDSLSLQRQLEAFAKGWRLPAPEKKHEEKMRLVASQLQAEERQALLAWWQQQR
ncbi:MAG: hypothetical protein RL095_1937 [Verrucomicrobiota bacterium]|jgi:cytochrome c553